MKRVLPAIVALLGLAGFLSAQQPDFESITIEHGLSQGMIFDILQTRDGFLWVATKDGLNRFDGYNFKVFSNDPYDSLSLSENTVTALFEDSRGWLWVGTESKGLDLYDRRRGFFHHFSLDFKPGNAVISYEIQSIREAPDGSIWAIQEGGGLIHVSIPESWKSEVPAAADLSQSTLVKQLRVDMDVSNIKIPEFLIDFAFGEGDSLLLFSNYKEYLINRSSGNVQVLENPQFPDYFEDVVIRSDKLGRQIWFINNKGVYRWANNQMSQFPLPSYLKVQRPHVDIDANNNVWLLIDKKLWQVLPDKTIDFAQPDWVMDEMPTRLATDRNGNVWVGSLGYGLRKFNPRKKVFHAGANGSTVWGLWRDTRGRYYCKVVNQIYPYDPVTGKVGTSFAFPDAPPRHLDIAMEPSGVLWVLCREEEETGKAELRCYHPDGQLLASHTFNFNPHVYARLLRNREGKFWLSGANCQLVRFDPRTGQFEYFTYAHLFTEKATSIRALALAEDGNGVLWIGTRQGLIKCTPKGEGFDFQLIQADAKDRSGLSNNVIACLLPDPADPGGILWIGTKGGGINRLDLRSNRFQHINTKSGLPNNVVYGILPGSKDEFWCSTNRGLAKLSPKGADKRTFEITTFTAATGLQDNEFNTQAFSKASNGELLFGGVKGLNRFFPEALRLDTTPSPVFVVGMEINHQPAYFEGSDNPWGMPLEYLKVLHLDHNQNNLSFEFTALDFTDPAKNRYRYRLVGLDADWVDTGSKHFAHFTHLAPGTYTFLVQGSNGEGPWQDASNAIKVVVHPPWWQSKLAYFIYLMAVFAAAWQAYQFQIRRVKLREQLAFEHRETERIRAVEQMKTNFFSNITHEFRTPLTLIAEPVRQLLQNPRDPLLADKLKMVDHNSQRLLGLVNQLLDLAKLESGSMQLDLRSGDFKQTVQAVFESFLPLSAQRGVQLSFSGKVETPISLLDDHKIELVLNNLLSNALKFTATGGKVKVLVGTRHGEEDLKKGAAPASLPNTLFVLVADDGIGIPAADLEKIFDRFYQVDPDSNRDARIQEGSGIGLALSKELAVLMGGGIDVKSPAPGTEKGSVFEFWLPIRTDPRTASQVPDTFFGSEPAAAEKSNAGRNGVERPVVLVVEDNAELRAFIRISIADYAQVIEAQDGEAGLQMAVELLPDLVISDLMMPKKDGYALCEALKTAELTAHIPVILLTAKAGMEAKLKGLRTGADDYLTKPFQTEELLTRMENLLEQRRRLRQSYLRLAADPENEIYTTPALLSEQDQEFLRRFTLLLKQNLSDEALGVEEFAKKMFISRVQLHRKLKAITDQTATDFIRSYRLEQAMELLKHRKGMVADVASQVGFSNEKYFSTVFKEKFGISPSQVGA